jgi:hypothetical protein
MIIFASSAKVDPTLLSKTEPFAAWLAPATDFMAS